MFWTFLMTLSAVSVSLFHSWCGINMDYTFSLPDWITDCKALGGTQKSESDSNLKQHYNLLRVNQ